MQISDLLQLQSAAKAGQPSSGPTPDAGRANAPAIAPAAAAAHGFGAQLRRAIERQASAAATDVPPQPRPETAVDLAELSGLEPLDSAVTEADAADAADAALPAQASSAALAFDSASARASMPGGFDGDRTRIDYQGQAAGVDVTGTLAGQASVERFDPLARSHVLRTGPGYESSQGRQPAQAGFSGDELGWTPREVAHSMPSTTDVLRSAALRVTAAEPSVPSGEADPSAAAARAPVERLAASIETQPAGMRRPAGDARAGAGIPSAPVSVRSQVSAAAQTGTRSDAGVAATFSGSQALPGQPALQSPSIAPRQAREQSAASPVPSVRAPLAPANAAVELPAAAQGRATSPVWGPVLVGRAEAAPEAVPGAPLTRPGTAAVLQTRGQATLRTAALGPAMDLVVGEEPEPGIDALLSYARRSGFSPQALQKLFGPDTGPTAGMAPGVTPASGSAQPPVATPAAVLGVALPAEVQQRSSDPAVLSMAAWIGGRAGTSATGVRSLHAAASSSSPSAPVSERIDLVAAPVLRTAAAESAATGGLPASVAAASSAAATQPAGAFAATVTVPGDAAPASHADLAHRLAQATATRMVAELRQGNGSLRLQIEPASLGKVDIDMTLRQGSLEATLVAHQPVTRELLADALPRLRETLAQLGMNVAGVDIRSGFNGQNDGKSTKQQNREIWYSARRGSMVEPTSPVDGGDQRRSSKLDLWA